MSVATDTIRNGVDTEKMFATLDLIKEQPELAKFQFRATNRWVDGSHNRSSIKDFYGAGGHRARCEVCAPETPSGAAQCLTQCWMGDQPSQRVS